MDLLRVVRVYDRTCVGWTLWVYPLSFNSTPAWVVWWPMCSHHQIWLQRSLESGFWKVQSLWLISHLATHNAFVEIHCSGHWSCMLRIVCERLGEAGMCMGACLPWSPVDIYKCILALPSNWTWGTSTTNIWSMWTPYLCSKHDE